MVFEVLFECVLPLVISSLINTLKSFSAATAETSSGIIGDINRMITSWAGGDTMTSIIYHGLILLLLATLSLICGGLAGKTVAVASSGFGKNLRKDLYYSIQDFSFANIDKFSASSLVTRLTTDVTNVQNAYMMIIRIGIRAPLMFAISLILSFRISTTVSLISLALVLVLLSFGLLIITKAIPIFNKVFKKYDKMNESVEENVKGMRVVKAYVREEHEKKKFSAASEDIKKGLMRAEKIIALANPLMMTIMYLTMLSVVFVGSLIVMDYAHPFGDYIDIGEITSLITYAMQALASLMMVSMILVMCSMAVESGRRIYEVLEEKSTLMNRENALTEVKSGDVVFENVSFKYSEKAEKNALEGINLTIKSGETVGILGGTGSAKTTLVQLVPRLYDATEGRVLVGGEDVRKYDLTALRNAVSMVLQKNLLFSGTIKDNLRWGNPDADDDKIKRACALACADSFIESFPDKYDTKIEQGGTNVSGGQRQRLCIARALLKNPKIIIMDDSTSAVDTKTDAQIRKAFAENIPDITKIVIAQRISSVQNADKIVVMDGGGINAVGTHAELLRDNPIYREVYYSQNKEEE
jgi:ATP-binding cassette subfamily B protein